MKLFTGSSNSKLAGEVSRLLSLPLSKAEVVRFENSEVRVRIEDDVKNQNCLILQSTANPTDTHLMELFFFCDALRRKEARKVIGIIPYFGYARQDIQHREGECVSANVIIRFIESIGFYKVYTINLHDEATEGVFSIPFKNISALPVLAEQVKNYLGTVATPETVAIVSPDQGGVERARKFGESFFNNGDFSLAVIEKKRNLEKLHVSQALDLYGFVKNKTAVLVDDMVTSGGTLINAANLCLKHGAKKVVAAIVHHDFSPSAPAELETSRLEKIITSNTVLLKENQKFPKLKEVSIAGLIANELENLL